MPRPLLATLAVACLLLAACSTPLEPVSAADLFRTCRDLRFTGPADEDLVVEPIPDDVKQILDAEITRIGAEAVGTDVVQWFLVSRTDEEITIAHKRSNGDADSYTQGHLRLTDEGWRGGSWGPCEVRFNVDDRQLLYWDLAGDVDASNSTISVLAAPWMCGAETPLDSADVQPLIISNAERVTVVLVAPLPPESDDMSCRVAPEQFLTVDLGEPLGDRELHDGGARGIGSLRYRAPNQHAAS